MPLPAPFQLERYFARYEFSARYLLSASDCEALTQAELLQMASPESMELWQGLSLGYTESPGHPALRAAAAQLYQGLPPENILIAAPEEAIFLAMQTLLSPGDHVIVTAPAYQSLHEIARSLGCRLTPWQVRLGPGGWQVDLDELRASLTPQTRLIVLNFPHNPTGHLISHAELLAVVELARRHGLYLFSDEMYRLLENGQTLRLPAACELYEKGISLSGLSKAFALPGLRIGWLAAEDAALIERCLALKDYTTICSSAPSEILGLIALQNGEHILQRNLQILKTNQGLAADFFAAHPQRLAWLPPKAGSVAFPLWLGPGPVEQFCQELLAAHSVMITPGSLFAYPDLSGATSRHFRLGLGRKNFGQALGQLELYLKKT